MRRVKSWLVGFLIGSGIGAVLVFLFTPETSEEIRQRLSDGYQEVMKEAQQASKARRAELEAQLAEMRKER